MRFNKILLYGVLGLVLGAFWKAPSALAQCNVTASVVNNTFVLTLLNPQPGSTYTWNTTTNGGTPIANGSLAPPNWSVSFPFAPPNFFIFTVNRDGMPCASYRVSMGDDCEAAGFTTTVVPANCSASFQPLNFGGIVWHTWNFGDGSPESYETAPTHEYQSNNTFNVSHWMITAGTGGPLQLPSFDIARCNQSVIMDCTQNPTIVDDVDCCKLRLRGFGQFSNCQHLWQVRPVGSSTVLYSSTAQEATWYITNINTNVVTQVDVYHKITCNGSILSETTTTYSFVSKGIFVGENPNNPSGPMPDPTADVSLNTATCAFNGLGVFPAGTTFSSTKIFVNSDLQIDRPGTISFTDDDVCVSECAGITIPTGRRLNVLRDTIHEGNCGAWRGINVDAKGRLDISGASTSQYMNVRGAMQAVSAVEGSILGAFTNVRFSNNYVGLLVRGKIVSPTAPSNAGNVLNNCDFTTSGALPSACLQVADPDVLSRAGTFSTARGFAGVMSLGSNFRNSNGVNHFSALANGIWADNPLTTTFSGGITVPTFSNCMFNNITVLPAYGNLRSGRAIYFLHNNSGRRMAVTANTFSNCAAGIVAESQAPGTVLAATANAFSNCSRSVDLAQGMAGQFGVWNPGNVTTLVENNRFATNQFAAVRFTTSSANASTIRIQNNTINFTVSAGDGILLQSTAGPVANNITVSGNTLALNGNNSRGIALLNMRGVQVIGTNTVNSAAPGNKRGIYVENGGNNTFSDNTLINCNIGMEAQNSTMNVIGSGIL